MGYLHSGSWDISIQGHGILNGDSNHRISPFCVMGWLHSETWDISILCHGSSPFRVENISILGHESSPFWVVSIPRACRHRDASVHRVCRPWDISIQAHGMCPSSVVGRPHSKLSSCAMRRDSPRGFLRTRPRRGAARRDTEKAARPRRGRGRTPQTRGGTPRVRWTGADRHRPPQCFRTALPPRCSSRPGKDSTVKTRESQGSDFAQQGKSSFVC